MKELSNTCIIFFVFWELECLRVHLDVLHYFKKCADKINVLLHIKSKYICGKLNILLFFWAWQNL